MLIDMGTLHILSSFFTDSRRCKAVKHFHRSYANATNDSSIVTTDLRPWTRQCRTALSNAERAGVACRRVSESSKCSALGPGADGRSRFVAKVSSWLAQLERQSPQSKKQIWKTPFSRFAVSGSTLSICETVVIRVSSFWALSVARKWSGRHGWRVGDWDWDLEVV